MPEHSSASLQENVTRVVQALLGISGMRQHDLLDLLEMAQPTLSQKMSGSRRWSIDDLESLARAFGVTPKMFLTEPGDIFGDALKAHASLTRRYVTPQRLHLVGATA